MMLERGLTVDHTTVYRWVLAYAPELDKRCRPDLKPTLDSWRVDETYITHIPQVRTQNAVFLRDDSITIRYQSTRY